MNDKQRKAMYAKKKCDFNFECEDVARDGSSKSWFYRVENNAPAKHKIVFSNKEYPDTVHEYDVCDSCLDTIDDNEFGDGNNITHNIERYKYNGDVDSYKGKRSKKGEYQITKPMTSSQYQKMMKELARQKTLTPEQRQRELDIFHKKMIPKIRKANMKTYGRYIIDEKGNYIGDKELAKKYGR